MSARAPASRNELLDVFKSVAAQFDSVRSSIRQREQAIGGALDRLRAAGADDPMADSSLPTDHPLRQVATASNAGIRHMLDAWLSDVQHYEHGTEFHARFGDSLLMFVYGKVKAGKSSLGNYLAYGRHQPSDAEVAQASPKPAFFLEADTGANEAMTAGRMQKLQRFGVGATETTSSIQGFSLPGMTWIDSPGIHSMTAVNGKLAEKYADFADLVVFLSDSSSPGRRSDLEEIAGLLRQGKPLVVLLTASDLIDEDVDDDGNLIRRRIMKSDADRRDQTDYVEGELAQLAPECRKNLLDMSVYPVSVVYAEDGSEPGRWHDSGMAAFAARVAQVAGERALAIKRETPLRNLAHFCARLDASSELLEQHLATLRTQLDQSRDEMRRAGEQIVTSLRRDLAAKVERLADQHVMDDAGFSAACRNAVDEVLNKHAEQLFKQLGQRLERSMQQTEAIVPKGPDLPGFSKRTEKRSFRSSLNEKRGKAGGAGLLGIAGSILGAFGGPAGVVAGGAVGTWLGSKLGGVAGRQFDGDETIEVDTGDNRQEVSRAARRQLIDRAERQIAWLCDELDKKCFADTLNWLQRFSGALRKLQNELRSQKAAIEQELGAADKQPNNKELQHVPA